MSFPNVFSAVLLLLSKLFILSVSSSLFPVGEDDVSFYETSVCLCQCLQAVGSKTFNYKAI